MDFLNWEVEQVLYALCKYTALLLDSWVQLSIFIKINEKTVEQLQQIRAFFEFYLLPTLNLKKKDSFLRTCKSLLNFKHLPQS